MHDTSFRAGETPTIRADDVVKIRNARNWKRSDLARYLGCNYTTVWRMENGKISIDGAHRRLLGQLQTDPVSV